YQEGVSIAAGRECRPWPRRCESRRAIESVRLPRNRRRRIDCRKQGCPVANGQCSTEPRIVNAVLTLERLDGRPESRLLVVNSEHYRLLSPIHPPSDGFLLW